MAVDALELRPRGALALFDAAVRLCATTTGVWAATLPAGALLVAALLALVQAVTHHDALALPVAGFTLAWLFRAISQGAASAYLEAQLLQQGEPTVRGAFRQALARAPGLITASMTLALLNLAILCFTAGVGFLFLGAHAAGYAAVMRGEGSALNVYGTAAKLLGPARSTATWVRLFGLAQLPLALNLAGAVAGGLWLAEHVLGFDVSFLARFTSANNGVWVATIAVTTFALFEPVRAATGTLLLIDGRVRQEGLDLLAAAQQLPTRRKKKALPSLTASALLALALLPGVAHGQATLVGRLEHLRTACAMKTVKESAVRATRRLEATDQAAFSRFVSRLETLAFDEDDCAAAEAELRNGLRLLPTDEASPPPADPRALAREVLSRPEFEAHPDAPPKEEPEAKAPVESWWKRWLEALLKWLEHLFDKDDHTAPTPPPRTLSEPMMGADVVMVGAVGLGVALLAVLLLRGRGPRRAQDLLDESGALAQQPLAADPNDALSRPSQTWAGLADELAAKGEFRLAIRSLYLALLSRLHRDGAIDYDPTLSNWEYLRAFKGLPESRVAFRDLTQRFDLAWYGHLDTRADAWARFRALAEPLLTLPSPEAARG